MSMCIHTLLSRKSIYILCAVSTITFVLTAQCNICIAEVTITYLMCPVPEVVSCPSSSVEKESLKTSCEKALDLNTVFSCFQSHRVSM